MTRRRTAVWTLVVVALAVGLGGPVLHAWWLVPGLPSTWSLRWALRGADRIRVRTGGICHRRPAYERTLHEETDPAKVAAVIRSIRIDWWHKLDVCFCCGDPSLEFYRGGKLLVTIGYHRRQNISWPKGWVSDGFLTPDSADELAAWLAVVDPVPPVGPVAPAPRVAVGGKAPAVDRGVRHEAVLARVIDCGRRGALRGVPAVAGAVGRAHLDFPDRRPLLHPRRVAGLVGAAVPGFADRQLCRRELPPWPG